MEKYKNIIIGGVVIVSVAVLYIAVQFVTGQNFFGKAITVHTNYANAKQISSGNLVLVNGYKIGQVLSTELLQKDASIDVSISLEEDFKIPKDSKAKLTSLDLLGTIGIEILLGESSEYLKDGDPITPMEENGMIEQLTSEIGPLKMKGEQGIDQLTVTLARWDSVGNSLQQFLEGPVTRKLNTIDRLETDVHATSAMVQDLLGSLQSTNEQLRDSLQAVELTKIQDELLSLSGKTNALLEELQTGEGSIQKLMHDEELYNHLTGASQELEMLLKDMREHPKRYVHFSLFGKKEKK